MSDKLQLTPIPVTDEEVIKKCKDALNKWSSKLPFAITRKLGDDGKLISASLYHSYSFRVDSPFAKRKFELKKGGTPHNHPVSIDQLDLWHIHGAEDEGSFDLELGDTCYAETCKHCHGHGKSTCDDCHGSGEVICGKCDGHRQIKCPDCGGRGKVSCPSCGGSGKIRKERLVNCRKCHGSGVYYSQGNEYSCGACGGSGQTKETYYEPCPSCHGGKIPCSRCGSSGRVTCPKCGGSGKLTCGHCKGSGEIICKDCEGRGWNPFVWHLIQEEDSDSLQLVYGDSGIPKMPQFKKLVKYPSNQLFGQRAEGGEQVPQENLPDYKAEFMPEMMQKWGEVIAKFDGVADVRLHYQEVEFTQHDTAIRYEYKYNGKDYLIWIDLTTGEVYESEERGLMTEWGKKIATDGDKCANKNPQKAIFNYAMACAVTTNNTEHAKKIRKQLSLGSWLFRLAAGGLGGWLWSVFMGSQGADPLSGWYIMGAMIVLDIFFAQKWFWLQILAAGGVYGIICYLLPYFYSPQIASDVYVQSYLMSSVLMFVGGTLLFARDFALRIRGGVLVFPILGALVGGATAPGMYLDFAEKPELMVQIMAYVAYGLCGLAILRTWKRYWVQNCGWIAPKVNGGLARFETNMLKPRFWPMIIHFLVFAAAGLAWYMYAGPGVGINTKARVADRFLRDERTRAKGRFYLSEAVRAGYLPAISQLAELQIMGKYGYTEDPKAGYELAVKAGDKGNAKAWRLQGYCLEYGKGIGQNLTAANARYAKAVDLGDTESIPLKEKTDEIAKVWDIAHGTDSDAQYKLAVCYANGNGIAKDEGIARQWLLKAADAGHVKSQLLVSDWLIKGIGGAKDPETGVKYCEKAALQDDPDAIAVLGHYYFDGKIIPQNYPKAIEHFSRACKKGSGSAAYMLGHCYREGLGVETNAVKAFEYFKLADERKNLPGSYALGVAYENGIGVGVDYTEALGGYARASEEEWEDSLTGNNVGNAKQGCERLAEIGKYWKSANADNDAEAQYHVGLCFANGTGVTKNLETAYAWYVKSADQNDTDGIVHMADALYSGLGTGEDKAAAAKAYERGDQAGDVHSTYMLAISYEKGYGFDKNLTTAYELYNKAAEQEYEGAANAAKVIELPAQYWNDAMVKKDAVAQYNLGCCFSRGRCGVEKDDVQAFRLFKMSAGQGNADAWYAVALCSRDAIGTDKNIDAQKNALFVAATKNHIASLATIGDLYRDGNLVVRDFTTALEYYNKAIAGGFDNAKVSAKEIGVIGKYWKLANDGDAEAQFKLGVCYRDGIQISSDEAIAMKWLEKAANQGNHEAEYAYAEMLSRNPKTNDATDKKIVGLLQKAVAANHTKAKTLLGKFIYEGKGIEEDYKRSVELWEQAAKAGDLDAKCELASFHYTGRGMFNSGKDKDKALKEWTEAATAGHIESSYKLGKYYAGGSGLFSSGKDIPKAKQYLLIAAKAGHRQAMVVLADVLDDSDLVSDKKEGKSWFAKSKEPTQQKIVKYTTTVTDTIDGLTRKVVSDDAINASETAKHALATTESTEQEAESSVLDSPRQM